MSTVKTYEKVNKDDDRQSFGISRMEEVFTKRKGKVDEPHRHDFYTVLLIKSAKGVHKIDFHSYPMGLKQVFFVSPGQVHQVIEQEKSLGFAMTFSADFLIQNAIPLAFISDLNLFQVYGQAPPLEPNPSSFNKMIQFAEEMFELFHSQQANKLQSIGAYLKLLLIQCSNSCSLSQNESAGETVKSNLVRAFKEGVDQHYKAEHSTRFYAERLNITPDHLNRLVKDKLGKTAKDYIQSRIIIEAKRLLYFTDLNNKEIGYQLGFNEPANFSAFFKKCTQLSPSEFKKSEIKA